MVLHHDFVITFFPAYIFEIYIYCDNESTHGHHQSCRVFFQRSWQHHFFAYKSPVSTKCRYLHWPFSRSQVLFPEKRRHSKTSSTAADNFGDVCSASRGPIHSRISRYQSEGVYVNFVLLTGSTPPQKRRKRIDSVEI